MVTPYLGQISIVGFNFAPRGWAMCDGALLPISQYSALFSLLGTTYGGDGRTTFALPDLRGRVSIHPGHGPGLSSYTNGQKGGVETVTLSVNNLPSHTHQLRANTSDGTTADPTGKILAKAKVEIERGNTLDGKTYGTPATAVGMNSDSIGSTGLNQAHTNLQPFLAVYHVIALQGVFPSRN